MMTRPKFIAGAIVWVVAAFIGTGLFYYVTPMLESHFAPVLTDQAISNVEREPGKICWHWSWTKQRYAQPKLIAYSITIAGTAVEYPVVVARKRDGTIIREPNTSALGPGENDFCANIPAELDGLPGLEIRGQANYVMPHGLWTVWQEIPIVKSPS